MNRMLSMILLGAVLFNVMLVRADAAPADYASVRTVMALMYESKPHKNLVPAGRVYVLGSCESGSDYIPPTGDSDNLFTDPRTALYADAAYVTVALERELPLVGYPARVWKRSVDQFENTVIALGNDRAFMTHYNDPSAGSGRDYVDVQDSFLARLKAQLDAYRRTHRELPQTALAEGCGAGSFAVSVATNPKGGQVFVIPTFYYQLCKVRNINPDDVNTCGQWREVIDGMVTEVSGDYRYRVRWHDGTIRRGTLSFDSVKVPANASPKCTAPADVEGDFDGCVTISKP